MLSGVEISRRLKAARFLHGRKNEKGQVVGLPVAEVAARGDLQQNKIGVNRLQEIEQLKTKPPPMELERIAEALGLPRKWLIEPDISKLIPGATAPPQDADEPGTTPADLIPPEDQPDDAEDEAEQS